MSEELCEACEHPARRHVTAIKALGCVVPRCECRDYVPWLGVAPEATGQRGTQGQVQGEAEQASE